MIRELEESRASLTEVRAQVASLREEQDRGRSHAAEALEIKRLSALLETEWSKIVDSETICQALINDGRRQDDELNRLRVELDKAKCELQLRERQATLDETARKHQDELSARARAEHHAEVERLSMVLRTVELERDQLLDRAEKSEERVGVLEVHLKLVLDECDAQDQEAKEYSARVRVWKANAEDRDKWRKACRKMADLLEGLIPEVGDIYDALIDALRARVQGDEGLRGVLDFLNWSREHFLVDLTG
ncbi:unnamed protein product [Aphanomyces euteiches]